MALNEGTIVLNQEKKDAMIDRILLILTSFFSWFKTTHPAKQNILLILKSFFSWFKTTHPSKQNFLLILESFLSRFRKSTHSKNNSYNLHKKRRLIGALL